MELKDVNLEELEKRHKRERNGKIKELDSILDTPYTMENEYTRGWFERGNKCGRRSNRAWKVPIPRNESSD